MVVYMLYIQATFENVSSLSLKANADLCISVRNPVDHSQVRERVVIDTSAYEPPITTHSSSNSNHHHHGSKKHQHPDNKEGECHFALKWSHDEPARSTIRVLFPLSSSSSSSSSSSDDEAEAEAETASSSKSKSSKKKSKSSSSNQYSTAVAAAVAKLKNALRGDSDSGTFVPILALDCQGEIEPFAFHPMGNEFIVVNTSGQTFGRDNQQQQQQQQQDNNPVDLSNGQDWSHVDLATGSTSVLNFQAKFE